MGQHDGSGVAEGGCRRDTGFAIFGQPAIALAPCGAALDDPAAWVDGADPLGGMGGVGKSPLDEGKAATRDLQQRDRAVAVPRIGWMGLQHDRPAPVSTMWCRLRPFIRLSASKPRGPPASVVLTLWLSTIAAEGMASRPTRSRSSMTR